jgi:hypothetical protein
VIGSAKAKQRVTSALVPVSYNRLDFAAAYGEENRPVDSTVRYRKVLAVAFYGATAPA